MLDLLILNSDATLNSFKEISAVGFVPGSTVKISMRLSDDEEELRYVPELGATLTLTFYKTDGTTLEKSAAVLDSGDRSMWTVTLSAVESAEIYGGNFEFTLDESGVITKGTAINALRNQGIGC